MECDQQPDPQSLGKASEPEAPPRGSAYSLRPRPRRCVRLEPHGTTLAKDVQPSPTPPMAAPESTPQPLPPRAPPAPAIDANGAPPSTTRSQAIAPSPVEESKVEGALDARPGPSPLPPDNSRPSDHPRRRFMTMGSQFTTIHGGASLRSMAGRRVGVWQPSEASEDDNVPGNSLDGSDAMNAASGAPKGRFRFGQVLRSEEGEAYCYWVRYFDDPAGSHCLVDFSEEVWVEVIQTDLEDFDSAEYMQRKAFLEPQNDLQGDAAAPTWLSPLGRRTAPSPAPSGARAATSQNRRGVGASGATPPSAGAATAPRTRTAAGLVASRGDGYTVIRANIGPPGYEIYVDLPGVSLEDVSLRCYGRGEVSVTVARRDAEEDDAEERCETKMIPLPGRIDPKNAQALMTPMGQLYLRVASAGPSKP